MERFLVYNNNKRKYDDEENKKKKKRPEHILSTKIPPSRQKDMT